jgi:hypothetical protein
MYLLNQENIDFMAPLRGHTFGSIAKVDIPTLDKMRFIKLGGPKFFQILEMQQNLSDVDKLKHRLYNTLPERLDSLVYVAGMCYGMTSQSVVDRQFIHVVGLEKSGASGPALREQMIVKRESYQDVYRFNVTYDEGNIDMLDRSVEKEYTYATDVSTFGWPTKEQLELIIAYPKHLETKEYRTDLYVNKAYLLNFNTNNPELYV